MDKHTYIMIAVYGSPVLILIIGKIVMMGRGKRRIKAMQALAGSMGFSFEKEGDDTRVSSVTRLPYFGDGSSHRVLNLMHGRVNDIDVTVMDYEYYKTGPAGSGHSRKYSTTVIEFQSALLQVPSFTLTPQGLLQNLAIGLGVRDINFESHPTFSRQSMLFGPDEDSIRRAFRDDVLEFYEQRGQWSTVGDGERFLLFKSSKQIPPKEIRSCIGVGLKLSNLFRADS